MNPALLTAVVTAAWILVEGLIGGLLLGRKGRPYRVAPIVIHIVFFLPVAGGWFYTAQALSGLSGGHAGSWISQIVLALGVVTLLVSGCILTAGKAVPAPTALVRTHQAGVGAAVLGAAAGIVCMLLGA